MTRIAFLGLGAMGSRMASRLLQAGHTVTAWNRSPAAAAPLHAVGAQAANTPAQAADGADVVFSMLTDDLAARAVWLEGPNCAATTLKPGSVALEASTVTPQWVATLGQAVAARGGAAPALDRVRPLLAALSTKVLHVGALGQGATLKLALNALFAAQLASVAELLGFLSRRGCAPAQAAQWLGEFPIVAPPIAGAARMRAADTTPPLFTIDLIAKDLRYLLGAAQAIGTDLPAARQTLASLQAALARGWGQANVTGISALFA